MDIFKKIDHYRWEIPTSYQDSMRVPGKIFADKNLLDQIVRDNAFKQVANVASLPGIFSHSLAMPDIHWGYGFPIGGVAAIDVRNGVVSPGGVGSDINCGVRLLSTKLSKKDIEKNIQDIINSLYKNIPSGIGKSGKIRLTQKELSSVLIQGSRWAVENGYGNSGDLVNTEEKGEMKGANPKSLSKRAFERGLSQLGTLGSGNHFMEIQVVSDIYDEKAARKMNLEKGSIAVMIHTGSRGLGYQVCDDYAKGLIPKMKKYGIEVPDRQLACAPIDSSDGKRYLEAMSCAANYAWANRQVIMHWVRESLMKIFNATEKDLGLELVYDVAHNIAKFEEHTFGNKNMKFLVHRKGATRSFGPGRIEVPSHYRDIGQPVIIPGDMGTASYVLLGTTQAMTETFGSTCHGAGRTMSRSKALKKVRAEQVVAELKAKGILLKAAGMKTIAEEMPQAYKDIDEIINVVTNAKISKKVARLLPIGVVKG